MCPARGSLPPSANERSLGAGEKLIGSKEVKLPASLNALVNGLRAGHGINSQPSLSTNAGARPVLVPIVVSLTRDGGFTTFLTALATLSALKEEVSGDVILTHSFSLDVGVLMSLLETSRKGGILDVIRLEISMQSPGPDGTFRST